MLRGTAKMDGPAVLNNQHPPRPSLFSRLRCCARGQTAKGPADCSSAARVRLTLVHDHRLRDEGTSYHYATPAAFADAAPDRSKLRLEPLAKADQGSAALPGRPASRVRKTAEAAEAARKQRDTWWKLPRYTASRSQLSSGFSVSPVRPGALGQDGLDFEKGQAYGTSDASRSCKAVSPLCSRSGVNLSIANHICCQMMW
jgi:hypothetical protein